MSLVNYLLSCIYSQTQVNPKNGKMISDIQLAIFSNVLGVFLFLLVVAYHYINANIGKLVYSNI